MAQDTSENISMDATSLYREEVFTDQRVGTIRRLTPVTADGETDPSRAVLFHGQAQIMTPGGALPINFDLQSNNLEGAVEQFSTAANSALEETMRELQEMRRAQASSIVVPGAAPKGPGSGGKFQLR